MRPFLCSLLLLCLWASLALAGEPHFTSCSVTVEGDTLLVEGKETGLGNETQVAISVLADASCLNPGSHRPRAANKTTVAAEGTFPVQNGRAEFQLTAVATFDPACSPPMDVVFSNISVCDDAHEVCCVLD